MLHCSYEYSKGERKHSSLLTGVMLPPGASMDSCLPCVTIITCLAKGVYDLGSVGLYVCLFVSNITSTQNDQIAMKFYGLV